MARLPDPLRSEAVLIGCSSYADLVDIPSVRNNLTGLAGIFEESGRFRTTVMDEPQSVDEVHHALRRTDQATDVLLLYYAGHGLVDHDGQLHLALSGTTQNRLSTSALPYETVRRFLEQSPAQSKILILDCCFSGSSLLMSSNTPNTAALSDISGAFILSSVAASAMSLAPSGERFTAFTGELIKLLKQGIRGPAEFLTLEAIAAQLRHAMFSLGYPQPQWRTVNFVGELGLVRNAAYDPAAGPVAEPPAADIDASSDHDAEGGPGTYDDLLRQQADELRRLKMSRGNPALRKIESRAKKVLADEKVSLPPSTQSTAFNGGFIGLDKLMWLVRTLMSWDEFGVPCEPPDRNSPMLESWRNRWALITALRKRARSEASVTYRISAAEGAQQASGTSTSRGTVGEGAGDAPAAAEEALNHGNVVYYDGEQWEVRVADQGTASVRHELVEPMEMEFRHSSLQEMLVEPLSEADAVALAVTAEETLEHTLARLFVRLGPPPEPTELDYAPVGSGDGGAQQ
ncbi:caspase domain-containing protein [Streptomyces sp. NPDC020681]|uniref:caspase domain-containing protein n=1 Tax=Streptomyces sp. NPDC020681 TaxID=3365083 RepID=UPI0037A36FEF